MIVSQDGALSIVVGLNHGFHAFSYLRAIISSFHHLFPLQNFERLSRAGSCGVHADVGDVVARATQKRPTCHRKQRSRRQLPAEEPSESSEERDAPMPMSESAYYCPSS